MSEVKHSYLAVVNGKEKFITGPSGIKIPAGSKNNFNLFASDDREALIEARKELAKRNLRERSFKGVIRLNK